jgi:[CysO sulfur-carrier protein]-S-L-cysteine hydrolase
LSRSEHLLLPRQLYQSMLQHAQAEMPNECCGLLAGIIGTNVLRAAKWYPLVNDAASPIEYRSEPRGMFQAIKDMRGPGHEIVAICHSHPTGAPIPSRTDLARNYSPDVVNLIIGLDGPEPIVRAWWLSEDAFEEASWEIVED